MENRINIGELDTMVTVQEMVQTIGSQGAKKWTAGETRRVFAKVDYSIAEGVGDDNLEAQNSVTVTIYKIPQLTSRWQVIIENKAYEIRSIDPIERVSPLCQLNLHAIEQ